MEKKGMSYRQLAEEIGTGKSQVQRLLNKERGGGLTLLTLIKAGRALEINVEEMLTQDIENDTRPLSIEDAMEILGVDEAVHIPGKSLIEILINGAREYQRECQRQKTKTTKEPR